MTREETKAAVKALLISDEDFAARLEDTIKPWVAEHLQEEYFTSFDGTRIHIMPSIQRKRHPS